FIPCLVSAGSVVMKYEFFYPLIVKAQLDMKRKEDILSWPQGTVRLADLGKRRGVLPAY
ncbi:hypothetical protein RRG08_065844, partial [Elysia crispata]